MPEEPNQEEIKQEIGVILTGLAASFTERAKASEAYGKLFAAYEGRGLQGLLRECENNMQTVMLNTAIVIESQLGRRLSKEEYALLSALPYVTRQMEDQIVAAEGRGCCVDKVFHRLAKSLLGVGEGK